MELHPPTVYWSDPTLRPTESAWAQWKTSFTNYLDLLPAAANYTEGQKLKLLRHLLGDEGQRQFDALELQSQDTLTKALEVLDKSWGQRTNLFMARLKFGRLTQEPSETLDGFVDRLIRGVRPCEYPTIPKNRIEGVMLVQQLISGITNNRIRECLLSEDASKLTWDKAVELARLKTCTAEQLRCFATHADIQEVAKIHRSPTEFQSPQKCFRCGSLQHKANFTKCPALEMDCKKCGKRGHFARCCRSARISQLNPTDSVSNQQLQSSENVFSIDNTSTVSNYRSNCPEPKLPMPDIRTVTVFAHDRITHVDMELDSASPITIVPSSFYDIHLHDMPIHPSAYRFDSYTKAPVEIRGFVVIVLQLGAVKSSVAVYVTRGNNRPLLGRNAMVALGVTPSLARMRIMAINLSDLQIQYPKLFEQTIGRAPSSVHRICLKQDAKPVAIAHPRPIPLARREAVSSALRQMIADDLIEPINCSEWVHPMVTVLKKDGTVRICNDLQALNRQIVVEKFVLPTADELIVKLAGARYFSKLDLRKAFFHMPLIKESRPLTAFLTMDGLFQYKVLPMGLSSAPAAWQKFMVHSFANLPGQIVYMDDICVFGRTPEEHDSRLHAVLRRLHDLNLRLNLEKCKFNASEIEFLGHIITNDGMKPSFDNARAITEAPCPQNSTEIKHFLGMCSYNLRYLQDFTNIAEPLRELTKEKSVFVWGPPQQKAFDEIKRRIASTPVMAIFDETCPTIVSTDASNIGLGAILSQIQNGHERVIAYASRKLSAAELSYSAGEKEALACVWACEKWNLFLFGRPFTLRTDHAALTSLLTRGTNGIRPLRIHRWYARLLTYDFQIKFRPGRENQVADGLSRLPLNETENNEDDNERLLVSSLSNEPISALTREELQKATQEDETLCHVQEYLLNGWPQNNKITGEFRPYYVLRHELSFIDGCLMRGEKFVAPRSLIQKIMLCAHESHPGIVRTKRKVDACFWWPKMSHEIENLVHDCSSCQRADKSSRPVSSPIQPIDYPMRPWAKIAVDIMGPFSSAPQHQRNCLVATCFYSKWPEVHLCGEVTTASIIRWLKYMFSRFGLPEEIVTDNGPQFTSHEFHSFLQLHAIRHSRTTPYNPAANGMVERFNRSLKESIQAIRLSGTGWEDAVLQALFSYRTAHHRATDKTPAELMLGRVLRTKLNAALPIPATNNSDELDRRHRYQTTYQKHTTPLQPGTFVRVKVNAASKGQPTLSDPIRIMHACGPGTYRLEDGRTVNARRLFTSIRRTGQIPPTFTDEATQSTQLRRTSREQRRPYRYGFDASYD
ncbi:unnamed protein product [Dicrocoelium dendriticum]|nr:unnamed protein product [Dicrocoelium dendriticum]